MKFICPVCRSLTDLNGCTVCGNKIPHEGKIYKFCDAPSLNLDGDEKYIGYDHIGEDFEPISAIYGYDDDRYGVYDACADIILKKYGKDITVLDLGAGLCTAAIPLAKRGIQVIAGDISQKMLEIGVKRAYNRFPSLTFAQMNAYNIPIENSSFDIVIVNAILHLIGEPEKVVREISRILKPNGCIICYGSIAQHMSDGEKETNRRCNRIIEDVEGFYYSYLYSHGHKDICLNSDQISTVLAENGFGGPKNEVSADFTEEFTDKLKFRLHRMKTGAYSDLQDTPEELISSAWEETNRYAISKYGVNYCNIKGFSRYGACIDIFEKNNK